MRKKVDEGANQKVVIMGYRRLVVKMVWEGFVKHGEEGVGKYAKEVSNGKHFLTCRKLKTLNVPGDHLPS